MSGHVKGALAILVVLVLVVFGVHFGRPFFDDWRQKQTSDSKEIKGNLTVAMDNWIGYFILCSPQMKKEMRGAGYNLRCEDDKADYEARMKRFKNKEFDFAVATVDSYILNAASRGFPGVMIGTIDESKGGDAILAWKDKVPNLNSLKGKNDIRIGFTPKSPSHHLLKGVADHFDVKELLPTDKRRVETNGSEEALKKLFSREVDVAVLWEPDVSRALAKDGIVKLIGTEDTERFIVDILMVSRDFSDKNPEVVQLLLSTYFRVLKSYRDNPLLLEKEIVADTRLSTDKVRAMLKGVSWVNLTDNCQKWFNVTSLGPEAQDGLIDTISSTVRILVNSKDFTENPLPNKDPYRLIQSKYVESLCKMGTAGFKPAPKDGSALANSLQAKFTSLDDTGWNALRPVGSLKINPINFQSGTADLMLEGKAELDKAVEALKHYPNFRVVVKGHTGLIGDPVENKRLSRERAESVARYLMVTYSIDSNRLRVTGVGSDEPLPKLLDESERAYSYRLPRVELFLVSEVY